MTKAQATSAQAGTCCCHSAAPSLPFYQSSYQPYDNGGYNGGYGQSQGRYSYGHEQHDADEGNPGFPGRRGLPTREDLF